MTSEEPAQYAGDRIYSGQSPQDMDSSWCWGKEADFSPPLPCFMPWLRVPVLAQRLSPVARQEFLIIIAFLSGDKLPTHSHQAFHEAQNWINACISAAQCKKWG